MIKHKYNFLLFMISSKTIISLNIIYLLYKVLKDEQVNSITLSGILIMLLVLITSILFMSIFSFIGNKLLYRFIDKTLIEMHFSEQLSLNYFFEIFYRTNFVISIILSFLNFIMVLIIDDAYSFIAFRYNYNKTIYDFLVIISYLWIGFRLDKKLKLNNPYKFMVLLLLPYTILMAIECLFFVY